MNVILKRNLNLNSILNPGMSAFIAVLAAAVGGAGITHAQPFPAKPVRLITNEVGGGNDFMARLIAPGLGAHLGQQVIVDNRPGGPIPGTIVFKSPPDGHTLLVGGGTFWIGPLLQENFPYSVTRDFMPITLLATSPNLLVVHPSLPVKTVKDLIALAKRRPGDLNYGSPSVGAAQHLAAELFKSMAGINIVRVPYRGNGPALNALIAGQLQMTFAVMSAKAHVESGRVKALAITSPQPSPLFPGLATMAEAGLPGYEAVAMQGVFAPAKTPPAIIARLNQDIVKVLNQPEVKERLFNSGVEAGGTTPDQFAGLVKSEITRMGKVIQDAGIRAE